MERECTECLWNWEDVHGVTKDRICYNRESPYFHHKCPRKACRFYETRVIIVEKMQSTWGDNGYVMPHRKGERSE